MSHSIGKLTIFGLLIIAISSAALAQPVWEDIQPLPNRDMSGISRIVAADGSMWATFCNDYEHWCQNGSFRPYYSSDGGSTWELRDHGLPAELLVLSIEVNPVNADLLLTTAKGCERVNIGPYISSDRGVSWEATMTNPAITPCEWNEDHTRGGAGEYAQAGWFADGAHAWCYIDQEDNMHAPQWSQWHFSSDSGRIWSAQDTTDDSGWKEIFVHPQIPNIAVMGAWGWNMFRTTDYGHTWNPIDNPYRYEAIEFGGVGETPNVMYGTAHVWTYEPTLQTLPYPVISVDTGATWHLINPLDTSYWTEPRGGIQNVLKDPLRDGHLIGTSYDTLYETMDEGQHWRVLSANFGEYHPNLLGYDPWHDRIYVGTMNNEVGRDTVYCGLFRWSREQATEPIGNNLQPTESSLGVYPNPFNATATLSYSLPKPGNTSIRVFDITGRIVKTVHEGPQTAGEHSVMMNGSGLASGLYFVRQESGTVMHTCKIVMLK